MKNNKDLPAIYFFSNSGIVIIFSYLVLLLQKKGISETEIGLLAAVFSFFLMISNTIFGRMSDVVGRRPFLLIGLVTSSITTVAYILPDTIWTFAIVRIFNGISIGIFPASIIGTASDKNIKVGRLTAFGSIGWAVGGLIGGFVGEYYNLKIAFIIGGFFYFVAFLIVFFLDTGSKTTKLGIETAIVKPDYVRVIRQNWTIYLAFILRHGTANAIWIFWALFLIDELGINLRQLGIVQATNMGTQFIIMGLIGDKYNPKKMFVLGGFVSAIAFWSFTIMSGFPQIVISQVILGASWTFFYLGALRSVEANGKKDNSVATGTGLLGACQSISMLIGPFLAIIFYEISKTYTLSMKFSAIVTTITTLLFFLWEYIFTRDGIKK